ncbi:glycosyltransferase, partial [Vibrio jasicida]|uniref:glycosyltransferase n=1 Tax=Vibrio jasicida TaxID=766224 RepID=UPI0015E2524F
LDLVENSTILGTNSVDGLITISYIGSFYPWQGVEDFANVISKLDAVTMSKLKIHFVGKGPSHSKVKRIAGDFANVYFHGWLNKEKIHDIVSSSHFLIAPRPSCVATETVVPLKVLESIQYNKPMICSTVGGLTELLPKNEKLALYFEKDNLNSFKMLLEEISELDSESYEEISRNLANLSTQLQKWNELSVLYFNLFEKLMHHEK